MTEQTWLASKDTPGMLRALTDHSWRASTVGVTKPARPSDRKLRLFACACCRLEWDRITEPTVKMAIRRAEDLADDEVLMPGLGSPGPTVYQSPITGAICGIPGRGDAAGNLRNIFRTYAEHSWPHMSVAAYVLREVVGNPYKPVYWADDPKRHADPYPSLTPHPSTVPHVEMRQVWLTPTVVSLAKAAYGERSRTCEECRELRTAHYLGMLVVGANLSCQRCQGSGVIKDGTIDPARLAVLSDALEEAGCSSEVILNHLRSPAMHYRGCWALDILLGKE